MQRPTRGRDWWGVALAAAMLATAADHARAQGAPVQFVAVVGDVRILGRDGAQRPAARGGELREGDTILTGASALAQLRLADGGMISVRGDTELKLDRFAYAGKNDRGANLLLSLLKGGFRSVTGLIGQLNRDGYKINTPFATIGIRGTVHNPFVQLPAPPGRETPVAPGTYDYVTEGQVFLRTPQGLAQTVNAQQVGFVSPAGALHILPTVPPIYLSGGIRPQPQAADPRTPQTGAAKPEDGAGRAAVPGTVRQLGPATTSPVQTAPSTAPPTLQAPTTTIQTAPTTTIQTAPTTTIQTAPLQTSPLQTSPLQTSPVMKPAPTAPTLPAR
jgi:hypothetical protein